MFRAVLDACTLVPSLQRDFLLQLATEDAFAPVWGTGILAELDYALAGLHRGRNIADSAARRSRLLAQMKHAFPGSEVNAPKGRSYDYGLEDADDGHVAHAALIAKADAIVTDDKRAGFKTAPALVEADIETVFPNDFAANTVAAHRAAGVEMQPILSKSKVAQDVLIRSTFTACRTGYCVRKVTVSCRAALGISTRGSVGLA